jgi:hypothetical protein
MTDEDAEQLKLLSIFHFVLAGLGGLCSLFPVIHLVVGISLVGGAMPSAPEAPEMGQAVGWFFVVVASVAIVLGLAFSACLAWAGRCLQLRKHRTFCLVMAGLSCLWIPFGTVLGVFTLIVLGREGVKQAFAAPGP